MTVMRPRQIILVDAPASVHELLRQETEEEPLWREASYAADRFWDRKGGTRGKVAFLKLLRYVEECTYLHTIQ